MILTYLLLGMLISSIAYNTWLYSRLQKNHVRVVKMLAGIIDFMDKNHPEVLREYCNEINDSREPETILTKAMQKITGLNGTETFEK